MKAFIECECLTEIISVETDHEDEAIYLAFWNHGQSRDGRTPLRWKWQLIKPILKHGTPYSDMVILRAKEADKLIAALQQARAALKDDLPV